MEEYKRDPKEDISLIRQMLEQTMDGMKAVEPWFTGFGIVWLIFKGFSALQRLAAFRASVNTAGRLSYIGNAAGMLFCFILAAGFIACRSRMGKLGMNSLSRKLVDIWGICIFLYLVMTMVLSPVIPVIAIRLGYDAAAASYLFRACSLGGSFLYLLMPLIPLLITADFLNDGRMIFIGITLVVLAAAVLCGNAILLFGDGILTGAAGKYYFWSGAACLLELAPGIMLLLFGRQLKGR
jgi:hypothetical protein